jgi:hypothetical protein
MIPRNQQPEYWEIPSRQYSKLVKQIDDLTTSLIAVQELLACLDAGLASACADPPTDQADVDRLRRAHREQRVVVAKTRRLLLALHAAAQRQARARKIHAFVVELMESGLGQRLCAEVGLDLSELFAKEAVMSAISVAGIDDQLENIPPPPAIPIEGDLHKLSPAELHFLSVEGTLPTHFQLH